MSWILRFDHGRFEIEIPERAGVAEAIHEPETYEIVTTQEYTRVYRVLASSPEEALDRALIGNQNGKLFPSRDCDERVEYVYALGDRGRGEVIQGRFTRSDWLEKRANRRRSEQNTPSFISSTDGRDEERTGDSH